MESLDSSKIVAFGVKLLFGQITLRCQCVFLL